jgi:predicted small secreted protein
MLGTMAISAPALAVLALSGCDTVQGVGRDVESAGEAGDDTL